MNNKNILSPNQIGFIKGHSTSDHIFLLRTVIDKIVKRDKNKLYAAFIDFKKAYDTVDRELLFEHLKGLGINGPFLHNLKSMYASTKYSIKLTGGYTDSLESNLGLKQGCPLSRLLFNLYIDNMDKIFQTQCDPIRLQGTELNHFLYADDLVLLSRTPEGLQKCLNNLTDFAKRKGLTISTNKSKTLVFNIAGRFMKIIFKMDQNNLEPVQSFCYLGFDFRASGTVKSAMNNLYDKASKAMLPLMGVISRFNLPIRTSLRLFHTYISPIMLYSVENWILLTDKEINNISTETLLTDINGKIDILHRKFLNFLLGTTKSCSNFMLYGESCETPLSLKGFRLMANYWQRLSNLPENTLAKKALLENIDLQTNWIKTLEKVLNWYSLSEHIDNSSGFKKASFENSKSKFVQIWKSTISNPDMPKFQFYDLIKNEFTFDKYLTLPKFSDRQIITKFRCSNHHLEIERGRYKGKPRSERICNLCTLNVIESEKHFLIGCPFYYHLKQKHNLSGKTKVDEFMCTLEPSKLAKYLTESFEIRLKHLEHTQLVEGHTLVGEVGNYICASGFVILLWVPEIIWIYFYIFHFVVLTN